MGGMPIHERFVVEGLASRKTLRGKIPVRGAKNAVLKAIPASMLFEDTLVLTNAPHIEDVERMNELLRGCGAQVDMNDHRISIVPPERWNTQLEESIAERVRASVVFTGPLLARMGEARFPTPGGDSIGARPINLFFEGFEKMGATIETEGNQYVVRAPEGLTGTRIFSPFVSVTATETLMLAAVLARGETILENAAMEPEIESLAQFLNACGAHIEGAGTTTIHIQGTAGKLLRAEGKEYLLPPDRIDAGSFVILGALAGEDITVTHCEPEHLKALLVLLRKAGVALDVGTDFVRVRDSQKPYTSVSVRTHEYPGFATDFQALMAVFLSQCEGEATILEGIFDGRFRYVEELNRMGAEITVMNPHKILVRGPRPLHSAELESPDIRAGVAYLLAAAVASGTSIIGNAYVIDRGYERIEERLSAVGLSIRREVVR